jgi:putative lipoprotein
MTTSTKIQGTVTYLDRFALSPSAQLELVLADISLADAPYTRISNTTIKPSGQVPIHFELSYDPEKIIPNHTYAVMARITDGGRLLFINDQSYQVITRGRPNSVEMVLKKVVKN